MKVPQTSARPGRRGRGENVLILNNVPAPFLHPLFAKLAEDSPWSLRVSYVTSWHKDTGWSPEAFGAGGRHEISILDERWPKFKSLFGSGVAAAVPLLVGLKKSPPDYLISYGYTRVPQVTAILWAALTATPFAVTGDSNFYADTARGARRLAKRAWLRWVTRRASAVIAVGTASRKFWESYGGTNGKVFDAPFAVDNDLYTRAVAEHKRAADAERERLGLEGKVVFLYVGRLIQRKRVDLVVEALKKLPGENVAALIVGDGEERPGLERAADGAGVIFVGKKGQRDLPLYYAMADALVLPSENEPWGLVVNEAMAAGLAVVAHRHCGAAVDLVDGENGVLLDSFSAEELAAALRLLAGDGERLLRMQRRSRERIKGWSIQAAAAGIANAVNNTLDRRRNGRRGGNQPDF